MRPPRAVARGAGILLGVLALSLPLFTPGARANWPTYGAAWLGRDPEIWDGKRIWINAFYAPGERPPARYATAPLGSFRGHRRSLRDRIESVQGNVDARRGTLWVTGIDPSGRSRSWSYQLQLGIGLGLLAILLGGWAGFRFRTARGSRWTR